MVNTVTAISTTDNGHVQDKTVQKKNRNKIITFELPESKQARLYSVENYSFVGVFQLCQQQKNPWDSSWTNPWMPPLENAMHTTNLFFPGRGRERINCNTTLTSNHYTEDKEINVS